MLSITNWKKKYIFHICCYFLFDVFECLAHANAFAWSLFACRSIVHLCKPPTIKQGGSWERKRDRKRDKRVGGRAHTRFWTFTAPISCYSAPCTRTPLSYAPSKAALGATTKVLSSWKRVLPTIFIIFPNISIYTYRSQTMALNFILHWPRKIPFYTL